ncbi:hypothetical protein D1AOALGA4SA_9050 [Olavius algarvensis Delta 1 endosymbiont]|nr:hypothetical protein D1AOALGA4SA_9050 [Olavius algarvensis Delta 1 endosymbiont]
MCSPEYCQNHQSVSIENLKFPPGLRLVQFEVKFLRFICGDKFCY